MEELASSRFTPMIERAAFTDAFAFERRLGLSAQVVLGDVTVQGGVFSDRVESLPGKMWSADGRIVYSPKVGDTQLHLGGSIHRNDTAGASVRYRQRPLVHFTSERFVNTGDITAEDIVRLNQGRDQAEEGDEDTSRLALPNAQTA